MEVGGKNVAEERYHWNRLRFGLPESKGFHGKGQKVQHRQIVLDGLNSNLLGQKFEDIVTLQDTNSITYLCSEDVEKKMIKSIWISSM